MKDNFTKKVWISFGVILGSFIAASGALYYYSNDLTAQANKITIEQSSLAGETTALGSLASLKNDAPKADTYTAAIDQFSKDQYGIVDFNTWLGTVGKKDGVTVSSAFAGGGTPTSLPTPSTPGVINFSLSINGPAGTTKQFLSDIETNLVGFPLTITSFDYTSDPSGEKVNAQGTLFFR